MDRLVSVDDNWQFPPEVQNTLDGKYATIRGDFTVGDRRMLVLPDGSEEMITSNTGTRSLPLLDANGGTVTIRRTMDTVFLSVENVTPTATGSVALTNIPNGFRPYTASIPDFALEAAAFRVMDILNYSPFEVRVRGISTVGASVNAYAVWDTTQPWPTTLPGVAA